MIENVIREQEWDVRFKTVFPFILKRLEAVKAKTFFDYGCGPGVFLHMAKPIVQKSYGYDLYPQIREAAQKNVTGAEIVGDPNQVPVGSCDAATMNAVWMQFPDEKTCLGALKAVHAALKPGGTFIASVTHPCFRDHKFATHETDFDNANYHKSGTPFTVFVGGREDVRGKWSDFHWTMADHINQLTATGFQIVSMTEVPDANGLSQWLIIEAKK
jgi:SAM-dependent methyltransferase